MVVVLSLMSGLVTSDDSKRKTGTPEEMQQAQKARRMEGSFPDFNRQPGVNGMGPAAGAGVNGFPPGFNPQQPNGGMNMMNQGRNDGRNGMPPPNFNGQGGMPPPPGFNGQQGGMNGQGSMPPPPGFNGQQAGMIDPSRANSMDPRRNIPPPPPPGFGNGQPGGPAPGMLDANGVPIDPRQRAHEQMKQQVRQRSNAYLQRMDTLPNLSEDSKSTMRADIEELYKVEAGMYII